jgi:hypothetical protein
MYLKSLPNPAGRNKSTNASPVGTVADRALCAVVMAAVCRRRGWSDDSMALSRGRRYARTGCPRHLHQAEVARVRLPLLPGCWASEIENLAPRHGSPGFVSAGLERSATGRSSLVSTTLRDRRLHCDQSRQECQEWS